MSVLGNRMEALDAEDKLWSEEMKALIEKFNSDPSDEEKLHLFWVQDSLQAHGFDKTVIGRELALRQDSLFVQMMAERAAYAEQHSSVVAYKLFLDKLTFFKQGVGNFDFQEARQNYLRLSKIHPGHPYNTLAFETINAMNNIKVGNKFVDFSAPDLTGNRERLSDLAKGKIVLLNLWATWCGPCITKSKLMLPLYEKYKDKGFSVIAVAGEYKSADNLTSFLEREKWPWTNLVDLDNAEGIWQKYNADNRAGAMFLFDKNGNILAVDPTPDEVKTVLETQLD